MLDFLGTCVFRKLLVMQFSTQAVQITSYWEVSQPWHQRLQHWLSPGRLHGRVSCLHLDSWIDLELQVWSLIDASKKKKQHLTRKVLPIGQFPVSVVPQMDPNKCLQKVVKPSVFKDMNGTWRGPFGGVPISQGCLVIRGCSTALRFLQWWYQKEASTGATCLELE